ncbi:glycerophosphodiester phosphodiesterase family protein [Arenibacter sp. M-2]|nr:glycerophosphodiester phosphodiesterase family protein [Arenibacter sp. M-2]MDL5511482.1 glycerophosphodiester phosphodiesterase family protein [Arenibacter sp. M-2]PXX24208.1 glycerophosphoryl diester phosphodiesterase [Arenibacter sp. ARW7G5Y1]
MTISLIIFLLFSVIIPFVRFKRIKTPEFIDHDKVKIIGHRGAAGLAPENTLASFSKALEIGVDIIELDIHLSSDDQLVVMHDSNVKRTTNGEGEIENLSVEDLKKLDAGSWYDKKYGSEKVPTLPEVFDLIDGRCKVIIEIKWPRKGTYDGIVEKLVTYLEQEELSQQVIIQSFETAYLKEISRIKPALECHQLLFGDSSFFPVYYDTKIRFGNFEPLENISSVNTFYLYLDEKSKSMYEKKGIQTGVFTVNKKEDMLRAASIGASYIITDFPNIAKNIMR